jgi:hypothetical protein
LLSTAPLLPLSANTTLGSNPTAPLKIAARSVALIFVIAQLLAGPASPVADRVLTSDLRAAIGEASTAKRLAEIETAGFRAPTETGDHLRH